MLWWSYAFNARGPDSRSLAFKRASWYKDRCMGTCLAAIVVAMVTALAGCAGSTAHARVHISHSASLSPGSYVLAVESWDRGGGGFLIVVENDRRHDRNEPEISTYEEGANARGIFPSGGGLLAAPAKGAVLTMNIERSCKGLSGQGLAYGLLGDREDRVSAWELSARIVLKKVVIPARYHAGGTLVYAQVGGGPTEVVTRTPNGRVISHEKYGRKPLVCH
jgi:hypothetical protein